MHPDEISTTPPAPPEPAPVPPPEAPPEQPAVLAAVGVLVRHRYLDVQGAEQVRYGLQVGPDAVIWLPVPAPIAHIVDEIEEA